MVGMRRRATVPVVATLVAGLMSFGASPGLTNAAGACVNSGGTGGCYASIQAAVSAVSGGTISVAAGTYTEAAITITKPVTLQGAGADSTIINATGKTAGIIVNAVTSGATQISGFTVENAGLQGIFVNDSSNVTIQDNTVTGNDKSLQFNPKDPAATACPDSPNPFLADDCGEAINLQGVSSSRVADNMVQGNAGGILLDDETAPTANNMITGNTVQNNVLDCGITLASHVSGGTPTAPLPGYGIHDNKILGNTVSGNGAAGVGIFASVPGDANYNNLVLGNTITGNGLPGVTMHAHAPGQNINGNKVIGNTISGNAAGNPAVGMPAGDPDAGDTSSTGVLIMSAVVPVLHTVITNNTISNEAIGIWLTNTIGTVIAANTNTATTAVAELAASSVPSATGPVTLPNGATPPPPSIAMPAVTRSGPGMTAWFTVTSTSTTAGEAEVYFGSGPGCTGLVEVALGDAGAGTTNHMVAVAGNDMPGTIGDNGIQPGATYSYEIVTVTASGTVIDNNNGQCYSVTVPNS